MKTVEERLRQLPQIAEACDLQADERLKRKILRAAEEKHAGSRRIAMRRVIPVLAALVILVGAAAFALPPLTAPGGPQPTEMPLVSSFSAGTGFPVGDRLAMDVPKGSISIQSSSNPSYRSIWARATGGNFPLIGVNGRYYRLLTNPTSINSALLGSALGTVDTFTDEPALAGKNGIVSNTVSRGETVYAVQGMSGALAAAKVNGSMRVFQRVSFNGSALVGGESLSSTLKAENAVALELSGVGTVRDQATARRLVGILTANAFLKSSSGGETNQSLLIQLKNGIVLQLAVSGERVIGCGTWACPEFFDAFQEAIQ